MRDLKFRAWDKELRVMKNDFFIHSDGGCFECEKPESEIEHTENLELMQSTGLKDKNGVDIFEGDVLHQLDPVIYNPFAVEYSDQSARFIAGGSLSKIAIEKNELVIIGNIHENPELLT